MSVDDYVRPKREMPNRVKSDQQLKDETKVSRDIDVWMRTNSVEVVPGAVSTVAEVMAANEKEKARRVAEGKKATPNLNSTISHEKKWGSFRG